MKPSQPIDAEAAVPSLKERKQQAVREGIWDVATDLFVQKGYDETTVDDIAQAAGISQRSFFRYFLSKGDLMAYSLLAYGGQLVDAIDSCPAGYSVREVFRETVFQIVRQSVAEPRRARKHLEILRNSQAAAAAETMRLSEVQAVVAKAYARRLSAGETLTANVLAAVTLQITGVLVRRCLDEGGADVAEVIEQLLASLETIFCGGRKTISLAKPQRR